MNRIFSSLILILVIFTYTMRTKQPIKETISTLFETNETKIYHELLSFFPYSRYKIHRRINPKKVKSKLLIKLSQETKETSIIEKKNVFEINCELAIFMEVYVTSKCLIGRSRSFIDLSRKETKMKEHMEVNFNRSRAIAFARSKLKYGDIFYNYLFPLMLVPTNIVQSSTLIIPFSTNSAFYEIVKTFISPQPRILKLKRMQMAHVNHLVTIINTAHDSNYFIAARDFSKLIKKKLNLTKVKPTAYALSNRETMFNKTISNFMELKKEIQEAYPDFKWIIIPDLIQGIAAAFKTWATIKVLFAMLGSNLIKMLAMSPGTSICCISVNTIDWRPLAIAQMCNIFIYTIAIPINNESQKFIDVNHELVIRSLESSIYAAKNQKFPRKVINQNTRTSLFF